MAEGSPALRRAPGPPGPGARAAVHALPVAAGAAALTVPHVGAGSAAGAAAALAILCGVAALSARLHPRARGGLLRPAAGALLWVLAASGAAALGVPWAAAVPGALRELPRWLEAGLGPLAFGVALLAAGGTAFGRLAAAPAGGGRYGVPDPVHALLGATLFALPAVALGTACLLAGVWATRVGVAALAAASGAFWPGWAAAEGPAADPAPRRAVLAPGAGGVGVAGAGRGPRRRRYRWRPPWSGFDPRAAWRAALAGPAEGGVLPMTVRAVSPRTAALRLLGLYVYAGLCSAPAAVLLALGARGALAWADPAALGPAAQGGILLSAFLALGACTALALRSGFVHTLELLLPRPRALPLAAGVAAAFLALRFGAPAGGAFGHGVAGALLAARHGALLWPLCCVLLPAAQAAYFFGLLQTRLQDCLPAWAAAALPAAAFAVSGPVTGVPLPGLAASFLLGLVLVWVRRAAGAPAVALGLGAGAAVTLASLLLR